MYGLKDSSNSICTLTLLALAAMVPVIGAEIVIGGQRKQIFTDKLKKEVCRSFRAIFNMVFMKILERFLA